MIDIIEVSCLAAVDDPIGNFIHLINGEEVTNQVFLQSTSDGLYQTYLDGRLMWYGSYKNYELHGLFCNYYKRDEIKLCFECFKYFRS